MTNIRIGPGELVDRFIIQEMKCDKFPLSGHKKKERLVEETRYLRGVFEQLEVPDHLVEDLRVVNARIWDILVYFHARETSFEEEKFGSMMREYLKLKRQRMKCRSLIDEVYGVRSKEFQNYMG